MTEITEVKTGAAPTTDSICPLMSGQIVPVQMTPGGVVEPGKTRLAPSVVTCAREKCQWWDESGDGCCKIETIGEFVMDLSRSLSSLGNVVSGSILSIKDVLEPPTESPLVRIADNLEEIRKTLDDSECLNPKPRPPRPSRGHKQD